MKRFYEYPRYEGLPASMVAIIMEVALDERESARRVGFGPDTLSESAETDRLLERIEQLASPEFNRPGQRSWALSNIMWLVGLAQQRRDEDEAIADAAIIWALEKGPQKGLPEEYQVMAARQFSGKEIVSARTAPVLQVRPDNQEASVMKMVEDACDLLERGYPIAAWEVLATTTREKRQECLTSLSHLGMKEEDWIYRFEGRFRCILCGEAVTKNNRAGRQGIDHSSYCPINNLDFGQSGRWGHPIKIGSYPGIRKVPVVMDPYVAGLERHYSI